MGLLVFYVFLVFGFVGGNTGAYRVSELRHYFHKATKSAETSADFHELMAAYDGREPKVLAFKAASEAVMAKYTWNPSSKLKHLRTSAALFEQAVKLDDDDPEIRFLRYTIQYHIPKYLNMSSNIEEDRRIVMNSLFGYPKSGLDPEPCKIMRDVLLKGDLCSAQEKQQLRTIKI